MKELRIIIAVLGLLFFSMKTLQAQAELPEDFNKGGRDLTKFQDFKSSINKYYRDKVINSRDSLERKRNKRQLKMWNREFWWNEHFTNEDGKVLEPNKFILEALRVREREEKQNPSRYQLNNWSHNGPTSSSFNLDVGEGMGRFDRIAFHPSNTSIIFAGSPHGGLFKSTNAGDSWYSISAFLPTLGISGIAIHPSNADIIYVLSGDGDSGNGSFVDDYQFRSECTGVYKTVNGGDTWLKLENFDTNTDPYRGRQMIIDPSNPNILFAATSKGLFKTLNGGNTWSRVSTNGNNVWDVKFKPGDPQTVYYVNANKFFRSTNGGNSFTEETIQFLGSATRISMAVTPDSPNRVLLLAGQSQAGDDDFVGIFRSLNSGDDWSRIASSPNLFNNYVDSDVTSGQVDYNNTITINPNDASIVLVGGLCVWSSHDYGITWEQETAYWAPSDVLGEYIHPDVHHLAYNSNGTLYCANDGGIYKSYDDGDDFDFKDEGLTTTQFYHFETSNDEGNTWGGAQDNGILQRVDEGEFENYYTGDGFDVMTDHPNRVEDGESDDIYYTVNEHIRGDGSDISVPGNNSFFGNLAMSPLYEDLIYVGYEQGVYSSSNAGDDWTGLGNIPGNWDISTCQSNNGRIYAAGVNDDLPGGIRRHDPGNWTGLTTSLYNVGYDSDQKITDIEVHPSDSDKVFISCAGFIANSKVYYTNDGGGSWHNWTFNLPNVPVFSIRRDGSGGLYVGTSIGVYYKRNNVSYWESYSNGLPPVPVTQIEFNGPTQVMISTFGRGIWTTTPYVDDCPTTLTLTSSPDGNYYKEADVSISSTQNISETWNTSVRYNAGTTIELKPGFKAPRGTYFKTYLTGCGGEVDH